MRCGSSLSESPRRAEVNFVVSCHQAEPTHDPMATPFFIGIGAIAAGLAGRHFLRRSAMGAADQWVKGGFKAKMDRKEAIAILGLKCACPPSSRFVLASDIL
jgi:hypothetical protein